MSDIVPLKSRARLSHQYFHVRCCVILLQLPKRLMLADAAYLTLHADPWLIDPLLLRNIRMPIVIPIQLDAAYLRFTAFIGRTGEGDTATISRHRIFRLLVF